MGSIWWNLEHWSGPEESEAAGNGWIYHAAFSGQPYGRWKHSVVSTFIDPVVGTGVDMLEIGPGDGRWTEHMVGRTRSLSLLDPDQHCTDACRARFGSRPDIAYLRTGGRSIPADDASQDVIWSFGCFVHTEVHVVRGYLAEMARVLRPGGRFVIHHSGWPEWSLKCLPLTTRLGQPGRILQYRLAQGMWRPGGDRMPMSPNWFASLAEAQGLRVHQQVRRWGNDYRFGLCYNDVISLGSRGS